MKTKVNKYLMRRDYDEGSYSYLYHLNNVWYLWLDVLIDDNMEPCNLHVEFRPVQTIGGTRLKCSFRHPVHGEVSCSVLRKSIDLNDVASLFSLLSNVKNWKKPVYNSCNGCCMHCSRKNCNIVYGGPKHVCGYIVQETIPEKFNFTVKNSANHLYKKIILRLIIAYDFLNPKITFAFGGLKGIIGRFEFFLEQDLGNSKVYGPCVKFLISSISGNISHTGILSIPDLESVLLDHKHILNICENIMDEYVRSQIWGNCLEL